MSADNPKLAVFEQFAAVAKALGHANRLEILELLGQGERSVEAIAKLAGLSIANTSHHLQLLRRTGLVTSRKSGVSVYYRLAGDDVVDLLTALRRASERHSAEVKSVVSDFILQRDDLEPIVRQELLRRVRDDLVTVIDVRPADEFEAGHLPNAVNIPLKELVKRLDELPEGKEVIAYCRGPYCVLSFEAVAELRRRGFMARRLEEGYPEWRAAGLPVEARPHRRPPRQKSNRRFT